MSDTLIVASITIVWLAGLAVADWDFKRKLKKARENKGVPQRLIWGGTITVTEEKQNEDE